MQGNLRQVGIWIPLCGFLIPGPGGVLPENWVGMCGTLPENLTLFQTKICDFTNPISDLTLKSIP